MNRLKQFWSNLRASFWFVPSLIIAGRIAKGAERYGLDGPVERWKQVRDAIHAQVCDSGFDAQRNAFVQS
jgi:GH15 family glucan-1,4-alpha-glucosidase